MRRSVDAVLLDMGGVLVDTRNSTGLPTRGLDYRGREAMLHVIRDRGGRATEEDLEAFVFGPWRRAYERRYEQAREASWDPYLERLVRSCRTRAVPDDLLRAWFRPYAESLRPYAEALDVVVALAARGLALALVSNVPAPGALYRERMEVWGLAQPFRRLCFSYDEGSRKPSPAMLLSALRELGVEPARAVMVGDRQRSDVAAGIAAGTRTVWLSSGQAGGPRPDAMIESLNELPAAIDRL